MVGLPAMWFVSGSLFGMGSFLYMARSSTAKDVWMVSKILLCVKCCLYLFLANLHKLITIVSVKLKAATIFWQMQILPLFKNGGILPVATKLDGHTIRRTIVGQLHERFSGSAYLVKEREILKRQLQMPKKEGTSLGEIAIHHTSSSNSPQVRSIPSLLGSPALAICPAPPSVLTPAPLHLSLCCVHLNPHLLPLTFPWHFSLYLLHLVHPQNLSWNYPLQMILQPHQSRLQHPVPPILLLSLVNSLLICPLHLPIAPAPAPPALTNMHPMLTRKKAREQLSLVALKVTDSTEPKSVKSALLSPHWLAPMRDELFALKQNQTWELVPRKDDMNVVGSRWVFKTKLKSNGSIERFKARLVAQGYTQSLGVDFFETFSPIIKPPTIWLVLSLAVIHGWSLR
uniref:Reverse transcriptase Ty1/copia-type domain-containing protein n=1 Tax=Fagus sylvatica TaxID=28930 RepID=A0A2N9IBM9_FAGSY